jgi:chromate reductase, NAD(P)H dehydrogenase (quinone)
MSSSLRVLAFSGSSRRESLNKKLLHVIVEAVRLHAGAEVTVVDLNDFSMPLYNGDLEDEKGLPEAASKLISQIQAHTALLITSPEYNSYFTPLLKNTIDWCTRGEDNPFEGKVIAVASASPGMHGGVRSMTHARQLLLHLGAHIVPTQCIVPHADKAFSAEGKLTVERTQKSVDAFAADLVRTARQLQVTTTAGPQR